MSLAERFRLTHRLPFDWHITLAYKFRRSRVSRENKQELQSYFSEHFEGRSFQLAQSSLCYLNDMTGFFPFDGTSNPFLVQVELSFPSSKIEKLVGLGGSNIIRIAEESGGAEITIGRSDGGPDTLTDDDSTSRTVFVRGLRTHVDKATLLIHAVAKE